MHLGPLPVPILFISNCGTVNKMVQKKAPNLLTKACQNRKSIGMQESIHYQTRLKMIIYVHLQYFIAISIYPVHDIVLSVNEKVQ